MSNPGKNPKYVTVQFQPQDADPANPRTGDLHYSDGTDRDEGLWVWQDSDWQQVSTGATLSTLDKLTLTPQAADPGTPAVGMLFSSDGTSRAAGLWIYTSAGWAQLSGVRYQEFYHREPIEVRLASTANINLASALEAGDSVDGTTLVAGNLVLAKNQTIPSENGVYVVPTSGAASRYTGADTVAELNQCVVYVTSGSVNDNRIYFQTETLTDLNDDQVWSTTPADFSFTVPAGVHEVSAEVCGAGGGGSGGSADIDSSATRKAGGGGAGCVPFFTKILTTPGEVITIAGGRGGLPSVAVNTDTGSTTPSAGEDGTDLIITALSRTITVPGANGAASAGRADAVGDGAAGGSATSTITGLFYTAGGRGGNSGSAVANTEAGSTVYAAASTTSSTGRGGGGGSGRSAGGNPPVSGAAGNSAAAGSGAGGSGTGANAANGTRAGRGGSAYVCFSWS